MNKYDGFGAKFKKLRENLNKTQQEIADDLGIVRSSISKYESGLQRPSSEQLQKISNYFNVPVSYLLDEAPKECEILYNKLLEKGLIHTGMSEKEIDKVVDKIISIYKIMQE